MGQKPRSRLIALALAVGSALLLNIAASPAAAQTIGLQSRLDQALGTLNPAAAAPTPAFGFSGTDWVNTDIPHDTALQKYAETDAKYVRVPVNWQIYEPTEGAYSFGYLLYLYDTYVRMKANGQTPIFLVYGTPYWALTEAGRGAWKGYSLCADNNNATQCFAPPDVRNDNIRQHWQNFNGVMAYIMPDAVFEIWNEPNIDWSWLQPQDPELYGLMLKSAAEIIHLGSPTATVLSGSMSAYNGPDTPQNTSYTTFLREMYQVAGADSFDGLGFHAYPCNYTPTPAGWTETLRDVIAGIRAARDAAGDPDKPLWLTETGVSTGDGDLSNCGTHFSEEQQGLALGAALDWAKAEDAEHGDLPVVLVFSLFNSGPRTTLSQPNASGEFEFGLIAYARDEDGNVVFADKPAFAPVKCRFLGNEDC